jgi:hypothetical protein
MKRYTKKERADTADGTMVPNLRTQQPHVSARLGKATTEHYALTFKPK